MNTPAQKMIINSSLCNSHIKKLAFVLPSLDPDDTILSLVDSLSKAIGKSFCLIVVNDGSKPEKQYIFNALDERSYCTVITHKTNLGKGAALKTAFRYLLEKYPDLIGCITADGDGQHQVKDIATCAEMLFANPNSLILGSRSFTSKYIPWKSRLGNNLTKFIFKQILHFPVSDTQTGLRGIPASLMDTCLKIKGNRFEFETQMLLETSKNNIPIKEVTIETVYFDANAGTHFHPIKDAFRIYKIIFIFLFENFFKFILSSLSSAIIDIALFTLFYNFLLPEKITVKITFFNYAITLRLFIACLSARILSSIWNYTINRKFVFRSTPSIPISITKYYLLCVLIFTISWQLTAFCNTYISDKWLFIAKLLVDTSLFIFCFCVQKYWIFNKRNKLSCKK